LEHGGMIEIVSDRRCIECDICVKVCPANVFDPAPKAPPVIARQADCQTCFSARFIARPTRFTSRQTLRDRPRRASAK
jgi:ferredoxin-like protein FixX